MSVTAVPLHPIRKGSVLKLWIALLVLLGIAVAAAWWGTASHIYRTTPSGLQFRVLKEGQGAGPAETDIALVQYIGRLEDGTVFDRSPETQPVPMPVAEGATVKGFSEGLKMMRKGGVYRLRLPPNLAYGPQGRPPAIPANATLEFDVAMLDFVPEAAFRSMMQQQMMQQQMQGAMPGGPGGQAPGGQSPGGQAPTGEPPASDAAPQGAPGR